MVRIIDCSEISFVRNYIQVVTMRTSYVGGG
jgi:hypothetical protein